MGMEDVVDRELLGQLKILQPSERTFVGIVFRSPEGLIPVPKIKKLNPEELSHNSRLISQYLDSIREDLGENSITECIHQCSLLAYGRLTPSEIYQLGEKPYVRVITAHNPGFTLQAS